MLMEYKSEGELMSYNLAEVTSHGDPNWQKMEKGSNPDGVLSQKRQPDTSPGDSMQTGIFLQQFTNSVNRALHKQNCTCNGRLFTADELLSKSNNAIYGPNKSKSTPKVSKKRKTHLPPLHEPNQADDNATKTAAPLKNILDRESSLAQCPNRKERLVTRFAPVVDEELRLPNIMDIQDTKGNNWKILQEPAGNRHHRGQKPLQMIRQLLNKNAFYNPHIYIPTADVNGNVEVDIDDQDKAAIESVLEANTPSNSVYNPREGSQSRANDIADAGIVETPPDNRASEMDPLEPLDLSFPDLVPSVYTLPGQIKGVRRSCYANSPDDVYHDEVERKALLSKYSSEVRRRKISYIEYLRKVSQMTICPCLQLALYRKRDKRISDDRIELMSAKRVLTAASRLTLKSRSLPAPDFASNMDTLSLYARGDQDDFTNELETLYTRGGVGIATLEIGGDEHLPKNFLDREREELRIMYPMYDWRVQHNQQQLYRRVTSLDPTLRNSSDNKATEPKAPILSAESLDNLKVSPKTALKQKSHPTNKKQTVLEPMTGYSVTFSSQHLQQQSSESLTRPPNQPPTTPVAVPTSVTIASASAPELLTINESAESQGHDNDDEMIDDNNIEVNEDKLDQDNFAKSDDDLHKSDIGGLYDKKHGVREQNDPDCSHLSQNNEHQASRSAAGDMKYAEQNSSVHHVSPASSVSNSKVNFTSQVPIPAEVIPDVNPVSAEIRPSVQLLQIDANVISQGRSRRSGELSLVQCGEKGGESGPPKVSLTKSESPANHLRPVGGARLATHQVVFVSPATTQA